jgi:hypothetical protein
VIIRTKYAAGGGSVFNTSASVLKSRNGGPSHASSSAQKEEAPIRLPSMSKCLRFKILPKEQTIIKEFLNMRLGSRTPIAASPNPEAKAIPHALKQILESKQKAPSQAASPEEETLGSTAGLEDHLHSHLRFDLPSRYEERAATAFNNMRRMNLFDRYKSTKTAGASSLVNVSGEHNNFMLSSNHILLEHIKQRNKRLPVCSKPGNNNSEVRFLMNLMY